MKFMLSVIAVFALAFAVVYPFAQALAPLAQALAPPPKPELTLEQRLERVTKRCADEFGTGNDLLFGACVARSEPGQELAQRLVDRQHAKMERAQRVY